MKKLAVAVISLALVASTAASAKPRKHRHHHRQHLVKVQPQPGSSFATFFGVAAVAEPRAERRQRRQRVAVQPATSAASLFAGAAIGGDLVSRARAHLGKTAAQVGVRRNLWCGAFLNKVAGGGTGSDVAKSWLAKPRTGPRVGAVAVMGRGRGGGHVGIVSGFDGAGNPIIISGNHNRRVAESVYPKGRVIAYVTP